MGDVSQFVLESMHTAQQRPLCPLQPEESDTRIWSTIRDDWSDACVMAFERAVPVEDTSILRIFVRINFSPGHLKRELHSNTPSIVMLMTKFVTWLFSHTFHHHEEYLESSTIAGRWYSATLAQIWYHDILIQICKNASPFFCWSYTPNCRQGHDPHFAQTQLRNLAK